jgi:hypothetical protein
MSLSAEAIPGIYSAQLKFQNQVSYKLADCRMVGVEERFPFQTRPHRPFISGSTYSALFIKLPWATHKLEVLQFYFLIIAAISLLSFPSRANSPWTEDSWEYK